MVDNVCLSLRNTERPAADDFGQCFGPDLARRHTKRSSRKCRPGVDCKQLDVRLMFFKRRSAQDCQRWVAKTPKPHNAIKFKSLEVGLAPQ